MELVRRDGAGKGATWVTGRGAVTPWRAASCAPRGAHPQGDPLPRLEHAGFTKNHGVQDAERPPDLGPAAGGQRWRLVAVQLPSPAREHGHRGVAEVRPDRR